MDPEALYRSLGQLAADFPERMREGIIDNEVREWLGRVAVLVEASGNIADYVLFVTASDHVGPTGRSRHVDTIETVLFRALARAEIDAPVGSQGTFVPVGGEFTAFAAVANILASAEVSAMFVDPYAGGQLLTDFAVSAPEGVSIEVLAGTGKAKPELKPAAEKWAVEYKSTRPLCVRLAPKKQVHDRVIIIDRKVVFGVDQSFNALAKNSPTAFRKEPPEVQKEKLAFYIELWDLAQNLL